MYFISLFTLASALQLALAAQFKVIAPGGNQVQVLINGQSFDLKAPDASVPYFVGDAKLNAGGTYKYVVNTKPESFDRKLQGESTMNDFYGRPVTYANIPKLPNVFDSDNWENAVESGPIFDTNYVTSVFINGKPNEMEKLIVGLDEGIFDAKITFIDANEVHTFEGGKFQLHRPGRKHNNAKQSWKWQLPKGSSLNGRTFFKIRHMEEDPTQIREKLYADILEAMGTYANRANMIRFFINGEGFGTFNMLDDIPNYSYVRALFNHGNPLPGNVGPLYDGASGASFENTQSNYDAFIPAIGSSTDKTLLKKVCTDFSKVNPTNDADIAAFNKEFDVDQFLRFMVMEYLTCHWDGYWQAQSNIGAYADVSNNKLYFLPQDFDATNGVNIPDNGDTPTSSYKDYIKKYTNGILINNLLKNENIKNKFEGYIKQTVNVVYNNHTLTQHVLAYHDFIYPDLQWDRSIKQRSKGINYGWTIAQVTQNLWRGVSAPNGNGGGASWGLLQWIDARSKAVMNEFK